MGSGKSPTKEETQRISFLLAEGFKLSEIHRRMSKFSLKAISLVPKAENRPSLAQEYLVIAGLSTHPLDYSVWSTIEARERQRPNCAIPKLIVRAFDHSPVRRRSCRWAVREAAQDLRGRGRLVVRTHSVDTARKPMLWSEFRSHVISLVSILPSFCVLSRAIHSPFFGISRCQASDVLLSISMAPISVYRTSRFCTVKQKLGDSQLKKSLKNSNCACLAHRKSEKVVFSGPPQSGKQTK